MSAWRWTGLLNVVMAVSWVGWVGGCSLYFGDENEGGGTSDDAAVTPQNDAGTPDGADGGNCQTAEAFVARFAACMLRADWGQTGMCMVPGQPTRSGSCLSCHETGADGAFLSARCDETFSANREIAYVGNILRVLGDRDGCFVGFGPGAMLSDLGPGHPAVMFTAERRQAIEDFVARTFVRANDPMLACPPESLVPERSSRLDEAGSQASK